MWILQICFVITVYGIAVAYEVFLLNLALRPDHLEQLALGSCEQGFHLRQDVVLGNRLLCVGHSSRPSQDLEGTRGSFHDGKHLHRYRLPDCDHVRLHLFLPNA